MSEKEKMLNGLLYLADLDPELLEDRNRAKDLCFEFNNLKPSDEENKRKIIKKLFKSVKDNFLIQPSFWCDYGYNIEIGNNFFSNHNLVILDCAPVKFGDNVLIAPNCGFYTAGHPIHPDSRNSGYEYGIPITIGDNVWIGGSTVILPGVTIGNNVVIGAGSVVSKDIPDNKIAVGNPCRVIREITEEDRKYYFKDREFDVEDY